MHRAKQIQTEQYTMLRSRLKRRSSCRTCHTPLWPSTEICPVCGANRLEPATGVTQHLPKLGDPVSRFRQYIKIWLGLFLTLCQAGVWLWLWPLPHLAVTGREGEPHLMVFYYAVVLSLVAT